MTVLKHALDDHDRRFSQIPLAPESKRPPAGFSWKEYQSRRPNMVELYAWFARGRMNRGIVTGAISGLVCLDTDDDRALEHVMTRWPTPMQTITASGNRHLFYAHPGVPVGNGVKRLCIPLDVRGDGGFVVAPGSVVDGREYVAVGDWDLTKLPVFDPAWVGPVKRSEPSPIPQTGVRRVDGVIRDIRSYLRRIPSVEGQYGSKGLMRACYVLVGQGYDFGRAMDELAAWNREIPVGPWAERDLVRALTNAFRRKAGEFLVP